MKKISLFLVIAVCAVLLFAGCSNDDQPTIYTVTVTAGENGTAVADTETAAKGVIVTLTAIANPGFELVKWTVESGGAVLTSLTDVETTFTMPASDVSVKAEFAVRCVSINGIIWALCNADAPGTFAANPEDYGMFYQWNRRTGWSSTNPITSSPEGQTWDPTDDEGEEWAAANDPCPAGWRVPTHDEQNALCDPDKTTSKRTILNGVNGCEITDKVSGNSIFLPAAGTRQFFQGHLELIGTHGYYWSATRYVCCSYLLTLYSSGDVTSSNTYFPCGGLSVRCCAE